MKEIKIHNLNELLSFCEYTNRIRDTFDPENFTYKAELMADINVTEETLKINKRQPLNSPEYHKSKEDIPPEKFIIFSEQYLCRENFKDCEFNGNGHVIKTDQYLLFRTNSGFIKDLVIQGNIEVLNNTGAICAVNQGAITGCINEAKVRGGDFYTCSGICYSNLKTGIISECENRGEISPGMRNSILGLRSMGYRYSQITFEDYNAGGGVFNNRETGRIRFKNDDSVVGNYLRSFYVKGSTLKKMLDVDIYPEHLNRLGENYLHILCQNRNVLDDTLADAIVVLAAETDINFSAKDKKFRLPVSYLRKKDSKSKELIETIMKERALEKREAEEEIDSFGF